VQTTHDGQTEQHNLGPANGAHGLAFQWIDDRYKAFHGEGHHKPDGAEAKCYARRHPLAKSISMHMVFALYYFLDTSCRMEIFMSLVDSI